MRPAPDRSLQRLLRISLGIAGWISVAAAGGCSAPGVDRPSHPSYVYYLHGKIIEDFGPTGVSPKYGAYDYAGILEALGGRGVQVISEARPRDTDPSAYADRIVGQIREQLREGVPASNISVVGASKGAVITALVSTRLREPGVSYALLTNCNPWLIETFDPRLTGRVLSIFDPSDEIGGSCEQLRDRSPAIVAYREVRLSTGLGHGFVYRPLREWVQPVREWVLSSPRSRMPARR
jgi:hypothetical protein